MFKLIRSLLIFSLLIAWVDKSEASSILYPCKSRNSSLTVTANQVTFDAQKTGSVDIRINNNDSRCSAISYTLSTTQSASLTSKLAFAQLSINSGSSKVTKLSFSSSTAGSYPVKINLSYKNKTQSITVNVTVKAAITTTTPPPVQTPKPTPTPSELPVHVDGTARINKMLAESLNVTIPAGVYMITGVLNVRNGHVISAAAGASVILKTADSYEGQIISLYETKVTVRGLTFDGNYSKRLKLERNEYASLVMISGGSNITFENNQFQYGPSYGIWSHRSSLHKIRGNTFLEVYQPIRIDGANLETGEISNNIFKNTAAYKSFQHLEAIWTKNILISGNTFAGAGLGLPSYQGILGTWGNSIFIHYSTGHVVEKNKVYANYWSALVSGTNATHGIIRDNYFLGAENQAVWIEQFGADYILFENNEVDGGMSVGDNGGNHLIIRNNTFRSSTVGIDVAFAAKDVLIEGNSFTSTSKTRHENGLYLWEKNTPDVDVRVYNNSFKGFNNGIMVMNYKGEGTVYGIKLKGNTFENNNRSVYVPNGLKLDAPLGQ